MPDHLHFFVSFQGETELSGWIKSLKNSLSKTLRQSNHPAPHWQKGYFDRIVRSEELYEQKWLYNPGKSSSQRLGFRSKGLVSSGRSESIAICVILVTNQRRS
jgi:hypothetical protein